MLARDVRSRVQAASLRESREWDAVKTRDDWEKFRQPRLRALRESLGLPSAQPGAPRMLVTRTLEGDGYRIDNLVFESRPGLVVTANLYRPASPPPSMPGILISHSHHNPKTQGELQDMGMTWARQRLPGAGHGPPRPRRAAAAPVPHRGRLSAPLPGRPAGLLLPLHHRRAAPPRRREPDGLDGLGPDARPGPAAVPPRRRQGPHHPPRCGRRGRRPGGRDGRPRPAGQGGRPVQLRRAAARLRRPRRPRAGFLLVRRPLLGTDPVPAAGGAGRLRPLADRRVRGPAAADLRPRVRLGPGARPGLAAAPEGLRLVRRRRPPGGRRGPRHPEGYAAGELPLQQHRPAPPQPGSTRSWSAGSACRSPRSTASGGRRTSCCA